MFRKYPDYRIVYIKGDSFTNELIQAIREGRNPEFREKYRSADVFLMDDVQFIAGRESAQEEMFHTFNTLYEAGRQIVFTADRPPKEMLRWTIVCAPGLNGACPWTSSPPTTRPGWPSSKTRPSGAA